ncbi:hypothetical protein JCM8547_001190 [Rhodosporidiobolus lusitaniae]
MSASSSNEPLARPHSPLERSASPVQAAAAVLKGDKNVAHLAEATTEPAFDGAVGRLAEEHYRRMMPPWRFEIRQKLMRSLEREMEVLVAIQRWRTPFRDEYFVKTSLLGTLTFFMIFLPLWFFYGRPEVGRGLLYVLALGAYATSFLKDAFSVPRPFSPPIVRLSVGNHALEYGFPSTHSSNSCSMALYIAEWLMTKNTGEYEWLNPVGVVGCAVFAASVVFGRLYTGMHSIVDVVTGSTIGIVLWAVHFRYADALHAAISNSRWTGTLAVTAPVESCPCFEDTVAFLAVMAGVMVGTAWTPDPFADKTFGWQWRNGHEVAMWTAAVLVKLVGGISVIVVWRMLAKQVCHAVLPPLFRFFAPIIQLPRRGYQVATEYDFYPPEEHLNPVPSVLDLPSLVDDSAVSPAAAASSSPSSRGGLLNTALRNRTAASSSSSSSSSSTPYASPSLSPDLSKTPSKPSSPSSTKPPPAAVEHKDVDVLTKAIVYAGIGWIATIALPWSFERAGLSVWA